MRGMKTNMKQKKMRKVKKKKRKRRRTMKKHKRMLRRKLIKMMRIYRRKKKEIGRRGKKTTRSHLGCLQNPLRERQQLPSLPLASLSNRKAKERGRPPYTSK